ncbi:MAG TPA: hypothetical protein VGD40_22265, partial [Chryseosolibacter sp.]
SSHYTFSRHTRSKKTIKLFIPRSPAAAMDKNEDWFISRSSGRENIQALDRDITNGIMAHIRNIFMSSNGLKRARGAG